MTNARERRLPPEHPEAPKYWMHEQSGVLAPVVEKYLKGEAMSVRDVLTMRAYLRQWIMSPAWDANPYGMLELNSLRVSVERIANLADIDCWLSAADHIGIDPL